MAKDKTFRVYAKVISYAYIDIQAKTAEEAEQKAEDQMNEESLDAGDFTPCERGGEFELAPNDIPTEETKAYAERIMWETVRKDSKYPESDDNNGFIFGLNLIDIENENAILDVQWFKTSEDREYFIAKEGLIVEFQD